MSHGTKKSTPQRSLSLLTATLSEHISKELQGDVEIDNVNFNPPWDNLSVIEYQTCINLSSFQSGPWKTSTQACVSKKYNSFGIGKRDPWRANQIEPQWGQDVM